MLSEQVMCKIMTNLTGNTIYAMRDFSIQYHMYPILTKIDNHQFEEGEGEGDITWSELLLRINKFMQSILLEGGLDYDESEDLQNPSSQFITHIFLQILSIYWIYHPSFQDVTLQLTNEQQQEVALKILPFKTTLSDALAAQLIKLQKDIEFSDLQTVEKQLLYYKNESRKCALKNNELIGQLQEYQGKIEKYEGELKILDKDISKLRENEESFVKRLEILQEQNKQLTHRLEDGKGTVQQLKDDNNMIENQYKSVAQELNNQIQENQLLTKDLKSYHQMAKLYDDNMVEFQNIMTLKLENNKIKEQLQKQEGHNMYLRNENTQLVLMQQTLKEKEEEHKQFIKALEAMNGEYQSKILLLENQNTNINKENADIKQQNKTLTENNRALSKQKGMSQLNDSFFLKITNSNTEFNNQQQKYEQALNEQKDKNMLLQQNLQACSLVIQENEKLKNKQLKKLNHLATIIEGLNQENGELQTFLSKINFYIQNSFAQKLFSQQTLPDFEVEQLKKKYSKSLLQISKLEIINQRLMQSAQEYENVIKQNYINTQKIVQGDMQNKEEISTQTDEYLLRQLQDDKLIILYQAIMGHQSLKGCINNQQQTRKSQQIKKILQEQKGLGQLFQHELISEK